MKIKLLFLARQISQWVMRLNFHVGPVRTQITTMQNINNSEIIMRKKSVLRVCSMGESELKKIKEDEIKSHICYTDKIKSKRVILNSFASD